MLAKRPKGGKRRLGTLKWCTGCSSMRWRAAVVQVKNRWAELSEQERGQVTQLAYKDVAEGERCRWQGHMLGSRRGWAGFCASHLSQLSCPAAKSMVTMLIPIWPQYVRSQA